MTLSRIVFRSDGGAPAASPRQRPRSRAAAQRGVTLIELMVGLTVLVILATIGIPTMSDLVTSSRIATLTNDLTLSLTLARAEAVRRGARVQVCPTQDGERCGGTWQEGWIVRALEGGDVLGVWPTRHPELGPFPLQPGVTSGGPITGASSQPTPPTVTFNGIGTTEGEGVRFLIGEPGQRGGRMLDLGAAGRLAVKAL